MAQTTAIEWCDSTLNLMMGCDGCELWNPKANLRHCYAGVMTDGDGKRPGYGGRKGWPVTFGQPATFPERLVAALKWSDLTGTERPEKPWLNGLPRMIFLDDMGDTFTESLPVDWMAPHLTEMAAGPHIWMLLTKRPKRMRQFFEQYPCPENFWLYTSVTDQATANARIPELLQIKAPVLGISAEPLISRVDVKRWLDPTGVFCTDVCPGRRYVRDGEIETRHRDDECYPMCPDCGAPAQWTGYDAGLSHVILGGESGPGSRRFEVGWAREVIRQSRDASVPLFLKQLGSRPYSRRYDDSDSYYLTIKDKKGGDLSEWPADLRVREFPEVAR
jgi:protein gp37